MLPKAITTKLIQAGEEVPPYLDFAYDVCLCDSFSHRLNHVPGAGHTHEAIGANLGPGCGLLPGVGKAPLSPVQLHLPHCQ